MIMTEADISILETEYRQVIRMIQHLPQNTAKPAIYLLIGALPIEGHLHLRMLSFFNRIINQPSSAECQIIRRQLAMKNLDSNSWIVQIREILHKYHLPSAFKLLNEPRRKQQWKRATKEAVGRYWEEKLKDEATHMKTLKYLNIEGCSIGSNHHCYNLHTTDPMQVTMASVKTKLLVQRYPLTATQRAGRKKSDLCVICKHEPETLQHFLFKCASLHKPDDTHLRRIIRIHNYIVPPLERNTADWYTQLILDPSVQIKDPEVHTQIEGVSRQMVFKLHHRRSVAMGGGSRYTWARHEGKVINNMS